ncbi:MULTISPECIES: hypothetical protein [unclassified Sporolactobacillus]|uniref:hypothetical protein n=1 Tax=unclassified Sporolactobacillus TaxID=2628533 RepID=UPI002367F8BF|nr:hypothetical protein [Sporolactobacillus sp. CQH2019]MDD9150231.1 hypothetical protein [Sporolactobacillus sp. CQH2019]
MFRSRSAVTKLIARLMGIGAAAIAVSLLRLKVNWSIILFACILVIILFFKEGH